MEGTVRKGAEDKRNKGEIKIEQNLGPWQCCGNKFICRAADKLEQRRDQDRTCTQQVTV
jgi:hypothetical protein